MPIERKPEQVNTGRSSSGGAGRFCVGNINPGTVTSAYMTSILALMQDDTTIDLVTRHGVRRFEQLIVNSPAGPYLDTERNVVVNRFMGCDADVLVFIDSDIAFAPDDVYRLVDLCTPDTPVVGGWYDNHFPDHGTRPVAFNWSQPADADRPKLTPIDYPDEDTSQLAMWPVDVVGTGFMAIHRSLLSAMTDIYDAPVPWFAELALWGQQMGEDVTFCMRVKSMFRDGGSDPTFVPGQPDGDTMFQIMFAPIPVVHHKPVALIPAPAKIKEHV